MQPTSTPFDANFQVLNAQGSQPDSQRSPDAVPPKLIHSHSNLMQQAGVSACSTPAPRGVSKGR